MAFRFFLVGAVAALGFDLPQGIDLDAWARSGRAWWQARASEFEARHGVTLPGVEGIASLSPARDADASAEDVDPAFATVIEDVVTAFAEDGMSDGVGDAEDSSQRVAGVDDASYGPEFADALNRWADGLSEPAEPAPLASLAGGPASDLGSDPIVAPITGFAGSAFDPAIGPDDEAPSLTRSADPPAEVSGEAEAPEPGDHGLAEAIELTGQALKAWLALVQPATP